MRNEDEVDSPGYMLIEPSYKINSDDNAKSPSPSLVQKSEEKDLQGEPSVIKIETEINGSVPVSNVKKEKQNAALGSNSSTGTKSSQTSTSDQSVAQKKSEEKKKEIVGESNKTEKDEVSDSEGATEQTLKSKAKQATEKSSGDSKARDGGGSGTSSSLEENIVLGFALYGSKRTLPIDEEP